MAYISTCSEMPDVQTAEEVLDWLTEDKSLTASNPANGNLMP